MNNRLADFYCRAHILNLPTISDLQFKVRMPKDVPDRTVPIDQAIQHPHFLSGIKQSSHQNRANISGCANNDDQVLWRRISSPSSRLDFEAGQQLRLN